MGQNGVEFGWSRLPGELQKRWPRDESGEFVAPKYLTTLPSVALADAFLINMLEAFGVPVLQQHAGDGSFGKVILGMSGTGSDLYVPETLYETARDLMEAEFEDDIGSEEKEE